MVNGVWIELPWAKIMLGSRMVDSINDMSERAREGRSLCSIFILPKTAGSNSYTTTSFGHLSCRCSQSSEPHYYETDGERQQRRVLLEV